LDFTNTISSYLKEEPSEYLASYRHLVLWGRQAGLLDEADAQHLMQEGERRPQEAEAVLRNAVELRGALWRIFTSVAHDRHPDPQDLQTLNTALQDSLCKQRIAQAGNEFHWEWTGDQDALDRMLWPVARSAAELLASGDLRRVTACEGDTCGWLFLDTSRNHSRRWCSMSDCGNRAKAKRHYHRERARSKK
jgi:predicted RNA-binding Zn ribbon-like protein